MSDPTKIKWPTELRFLVPLCLVAFFVFANSLSGEFVYDDTRQIVRNPLIQDTSLSGTALVSDVWAFKGDGTISASNYWRPTFTAFHILNFQLFGLDPFGWHLLSILLHTGICALIYLLLRRWEVSGIRALAVALIFAVHPVHTESVAWISGSPDLLFGLFFLGSLWFADRFAAGGKKISDLIGALVLYALALGSKEVAMLCFPVYFLIFRYRQQETENGKKSFFDSPLNQAALFALGAVGFFLMRWGILGFISQSGEQFVGLTGSLLTAPAVFVFYLKQVVWPLWLGTNYPLRPVFEIGWLNFVGPLLISVAVLAGFWKIFQRSFLGQIGVALFLLPLLPTLNIAAFVSDQIVHDRYLYLPLFGFLVIILSLLRPLTESLDDKKSRMYILLPAILLSLVLAVQTVVYNRVWASEILLWEHNVKIDPASAINYSQFGAALAEAGKYPEAVAAYDRSIQNRPSPLALYGRARALIFLNQYEKAVADLTALVKQNPEGQNAYTNYQIYEALAIAFAEQKKFDEAAGALLEARRRLPIYAAALTEKLAVVYYQQGRKDLALAELETVRDKARVERLPESKAVLLRLGMLYGELGRKDEARRVLEEYLQLTAPLRDELTLADRRQAVEALKRLR